jgi:acetoin utilization deacetylase AcuC-like enzyme
VKLFKRPRAYIVFSSEYLIGVSTYGDHSSFDIYKYKRIRDKLVSEKLIKTKNILYPKPCSYADIKTVHSPLYIKKIQDPLYVNSALKIAINSMWDNTVLEYYKAVCGGTILAAKQALKLNKPVFNLGGGFHHAQPDKAEGFCLLNDVAIAIKILLSKKYIKNPLIIDLDYHQGNGNTIIFKDNPNVYTFSIHADHWISLESKSNMDVLIPSEITDTDYLDIVKDRIETVFLTFTPDIIFFIAGSDPYIGDDLADMQISREVMLKRNMYVLKKTLSRDIPIVILPGGGYGEKSWEVYYDFISTSLSNNNYD